MKIISQPDTEHWLHKCKCGKCESQLEANAMDICHTHSQGDGIYPAADTYNVKCPVCSNRIHVPSSVIPKIIQIEAQKRSAPSSSSYLDR